MASSPEQHDSTSPDDQTRLAAARFCIDQLVAYDASNLNDGYELAGRLQGVSGAVLEIVAQQGIPRAESALSRQPFRSNLQQESFTGTVFEQVRGPRILRAGHLFIACAGQEGTAELTSYRFKKHMYAQTHDVVVPSDGTIQQLLDEESCLWDAWRPSARNYRCEPTISAYPFSAQNYTEGSVSAYMSLLQELAADLLAATELR